MPLHLLGISRSADVCRWDGPDVTASRGTTGGGRSGEAAAAEPDDADIRWVTEHGLSAATVPPLPPSTGPLRHAALLAAIYRRGDVLPMRFAAVLSGEEAVRDLLRRRADDLLRSLDRLQGTAEIGLRCELPQSGASAVPSRACPPHNTPVQYLAARRAQYLRHDQMHRRVELAAASCIRIVDGLYRDWRRLSPEPPGTLRLAFLVERGRAEALVTRLSTLREQEVGKPCTILGPWPPYSFV